MESKNSFSYENPLKTKFSREFFQGMVQTPGVYFMLGEAGEILYIGKAKNLKARVSSYSKIKPGTAADHTLEMIENVKQIQWIICRTEQEALARENELLHAIRPPFNILHTEAEDYLFIGVRWTAKEEKPNDFLGVDFLLSSRERILQEGYSVFGCFRYRNKIKLGYTALLRLIYAATVSHQRFSYPAKITRVSPPWVYSTFLPGEWEDQLEDFLEGRNKSLLKLIVEKLLENERIPHFMHPSLQDDIEIVKSFYKVGPKNNYLLKKKHGIKAQTLSHRQMDELIAWGVEFLDQQKIISPFKAR